MQKEALFFFKSSVIEEEALCDYLNNEKYNIDRVQQLLSNFLSDLNLLYAPGKKKHLKSLILVILTNEQKLWNNESNTATGLRILQFVFQSDWIRPRVARFFDAFLLSVGYQLFSVMQKGLSDSIPFMLFNYCVFTGEALRALFLAWTFTS